MVQIELLASSKALQWRLESDGVSTLGRGTQAALEVLRSIPEDLTAPADALEQVPALIPELLAAVDEACPGLRRLGASS